MARPRKNPDELRAVSLNPRLTAAERAEIERSAAVFGLTPSEFMRRRALGVPLPATLAAQRQRAVAATALIRLGVNLNQIARHMNAGRAGIPHDLSRLIARINEELDRLYGAETDGGRPVL